MTSFRRHAMISIAIFVAIASTSIDASSASSSRPKDGLSPSGASPPRGGAAAAKKRPTNKGSSFSSPPLKKGQMMKKKLKKRVVRKVSGVPKMSEDVSSKSVSAKAALTGDTMPSIFRIPAEEKYDRYAAALAVTEGLRRVRDGEIARARETIKGGRSWLGGGVKSSAGSRGRRKKKNDKERAAYKEPADPLEAAIKRTEWAYILQSTRAVRALGMTVTQFNQIGREVVSDPALKERVAEQAYLYRMASAVRLEKVPLLDDPSSRRLLESTEHKKYRVQLFARSIHEIEDLRADEMESLRQSLQVERFPPGFDLSDPYVQPLLHPEVRRVCERFPVQAEEIVKRYGLDSDEFNRMLEETKGNPVFRWRVQKCVERAEKERAKEKKA